MMSDKCGCDYCKDFRKQNPEFYMIGRKRKQTNENKSISAHRTKQREHQPNRAVVDESD